MVREGAPKAAGAKAATGATNERAATAAVNFMVMIGGWGNEDESCVVKRVPGGEKLQPKIVDGFSSIFLANYVTIRSCKLK